MGINRDPTLWMKCGELTGSLDSEQVALHIWAKLSHQYLLNCDKANAHLHAK